MPARTNAPRSETASAAMDPIAAYSDQSTMNSVYIVFIQSVTTGSHITKNTTTPCSNAAVGCWCNDHAMASAVMTSNASFA
jgi:hypothetical protein